MEPLEVGDVGSAIRNAGRDHNRSAGNSRSIAQFDDVEAVLLSKLGGGVAVDHLSAEEDRLIEGACGELGAADAAGEAEVVANHGARTGLSPHGGWLDQGSAQAFRFGVDGGR